jgi:hypothetical protein
MPAGTWSEYNPELRLKPDEDTIVVVIDPEDRVKELDESNNKASHKIEGRQPAKSSVTQEAEPTRHRHFVTIVRRE